MSALLHLVKDHGLREIAGREILKQASAKRKYECRVKYAAPYGAPMMVNDAPNAPTDPGPVMGGETIMGADVPTQMGIDIGVPVSGMSAAKTDRRSTTPTPSSTSTISTTCCRRRSRGKRKCSTPP
jgi:hypothetical protein